MRAIHARQARWQPAAMLVAALASSACAAPTERRLEVFAAASLIDAFREIGAAFQRAHPGLEPRFHFAGSNQLALQIEHGARADVFASADASWMERVAERGATAGPPAPFAANLLVAIVPRSNPARLRGIADFARPGVKLVLAAEAVPAGRYSREAFARLERLPGFGDGWARRALANRVSDEENVRSVVARVQLGEADAGLVYRSDVTRSAERLLRVLPIPEAANVRALYPIAALRGPRRAEAEAFVAFVRSAVGREILARHGFLPPDTAAMTPATR